MGETVRASAILSNPKLASSAGSSAETSTSSVSITAISVSGAGFSASGLTLPLTLAGGQSATLSVVFAPTISGTATGSVAVTSNATNSPATVALSGFGTLQHSVSLSWTASTSVVAGYFIYRATQSGGPYTKLNSSFVADVVYTDSTAQSGQTYYYVATAVDSNNVESVLSTEVSAAIPIP